MLQKPPFFIDFLPWSVFQGFFSVGLLPGVFSYDLFQGFISVGVFHGFPCIGFSPRIFPWMFVYEFFPFTPSSFITPPQISTLQYLYLISSLFLVFMANLMNFLSIQYICLNLSTKYCYHYLISENMKFSCVRFITIWYSMTSKLCSYQLLKTVSRLFRRSFSSRLLLIFLFIFLLITSDTSYKNHLCVKAILNINVFIRDDPQSF